MLCVGDARVAGMRQRWWAVALPDGSLFEGSRGVSVEAGRVHVRGVLDLELALPAGVEVVSPHGRSYVWTTQARAGARARHRDAPAARRSSWTATTASSTTPPATTHGTRPGGGRRGSAAATTGARWRGTSWTACTTRSRTASAPSGSTAAAQEVPPQEFADDLSRVGDLEFREWSARESNRNLLVMRNRYRQPFGEFSGTLPGGLALAEGYGVMEGHDVLW